MRAHTCLAWPGPTPEGAVGGLVRTVQRTALSSCCSRLICAVSSSLSSASMRSLTAAPPGIATSLRWLLCERTSGNAPDPADTVQPHHTDIPLARHAMRSTFPPNCAPCHAVRLTPIHRDTQVAAVLHGRAAQAHAPDALVVAVLHGHAAQAGLHGSAVHAHSPGCPGSGRAPWQTPAGRGCLGPGHGTAA